MTIDHRCVFCRVILGEVESWRVLEDERAIAFFDVNPWTEYHTLVVPKVHTSDVFSVAPDDLLSTVGLIKNVADLFRERLGLRSIQILSSSGADAQQDVHHLHFHVVPRSAGDGLDVHRTPHPELREQFPDLLAMIRA